MEILPVIKLAPESIWEIKIEKSGILFKQSGGSSLIESHDGILTFGSEPKNVDDSTDGLIQKK